jgi:hypothetical protein
MTGRRTSHILLIEHAADLKFVASIAQSRCKQIRVADCVKRSSIEQPTHVGPSSVVEEMVVHLRFAELPAIVS